MKYNGVLKVSGKLYSTLWDAAELSNILSSCCAGVGICDRNIHGEVVKFDLCAIFREHGWDTTAPGNEGSRTQWVQEYILSPYFETNYIINGYSHFCDDIGKFDWDKNPFAHELVEFVAFPIL